MAGRGVAEGAGWLVVLGLAACCGVPVLLAAGVAATVVWSLGFSLAAAAVAGAGVAVYVRRRRRGSDVAAADAHGPHEERAELEGGRR